MSGSPHIIRYLLVISACVCGLPRQSASGATPTVWPLFGVSDAFTAPEGLGDFITDIVRVPGPANRILFAGQNGTVIGTTTDGVVDDTPFLALDLPDHGEQGLLGMAFSPGFPASPWVYCFAADEYGETRIARYEVDLETLRAIPSTETIILRIPREKTTHVGGQIRFGSDGYLYISVGDDGGPGEINDNAQRLDNLNGKILRIDPEAGTENTPYLIPAGNPFVGQEDALPEIIAWGLRNPWRFDFHPVTGALYIADVGERDKEEINVLPLESIASGLNFGWPFLEGTTERQVNPNPQISLTAPLYEYDTESAVIGGVFFQDPGDANPPIYIFGDLGGTIRALGTDANGGAEVRIIAKGREFACFGKDADGRILLAPVFASFGFDPIMQMKPETSLSPPVFAIPGGTLAGPAAIRISSDQRHVSIRYTTDGSEPDEQSPLLGEEGYFMLEEPGTVRVKSFYPGLGASATVSATYALKVSSILAPFQKLTDYTRISFTTHTPDVVIRYTTDGSPVTPESPVYDPSIPSAELFIRQPTTVRAQAFRAGWTDSEEFFRTYDLTVSRPTVSFAGGDDESTYLAPITLVSETSAVTIRYTTDGSIPGPASPVYDGPLYLLPGMILNARATKEGMTDSFALSPPVASDRIPFKGTLVRLTPSGNPSNVVSGPTESTPLDSPIHVARHSDGTLLVAEDIYSPALWKLAGGTSTRLLQGIHSNGFSELNMDFSENLVFPWNGSLRIYSPPFTSVFTTETVTRSDTMLPLADGSYLAAINRTANSTTFSCTIHRTAPGMPSTVFATLDDQVLSMGHGTGGSILLTTGSRKILRLSGGVLETVAGSGGYGRSDGGSDVAAFAKPEHVVSDRIGNIYVVDEPGRYSGFIRKITPRGDVSTAFGEFLGLDGMPDGFGARFVGAGGSIAIDDVGTIYGANGDRVWKFVQEDWDNDGIPDAMEREIGVLRGRLAETIGSRFPKTPASPWSRRLFQGRA